MLEKKLRKMYEARGLADYKLLNLEDLLQVHGINYKEVSGYNRLDDLNRSIYEKFIVNFFNVFGLDSRATLVPKGIYWVEDSDYLVKERPEHDYYTIAGGIVYSIDRNGLKSVLDEWIVEDYAQLEKHVGEPKYYLRFEYEIDGRDEWVHVIKEGREWY
ncbi:MAG TPA: hypothetical protein GXX73_14285 [Clostridium sp.]|nr:hypothetical protein [Clostridium sp.]